MVNVYLGVWGIVDCFECGVDVVVIGWVIDVLVVVGVVVVYFGWGCIDYY